MLTELEIQTLTTIFNKVKDIKDEQGEFPSFGVRQDGLKIVLNSPQDNQVIIKLVPRPDPD
jgi:hypothetical protein